MDASVVCGRVFPHEVLQRINASVRGHPNWSRAELARRVCDWLDWRTEAGQRKQMSCRVALGRLADRGLIRLPVPRHRVSFSGQSFSKIQLSVPSRLEGTVKNLGQLKLVLVSPKNRDLDLQWKKLVATHHYLG